ncbi:MAG: SPOR domain-containing protein [Proteobacteria bacterium]|nr:SPOR domain-containing protein [Pseudomonadota bacterium]
MKWAFILLLLGNFVYLGWEIDRDARLERVNVTSAISVPAGTQRLVLLNELEKLPETRSHIKLDNELSMESFNSEPVLPIALNPNTEKMIDTLLTESSITQIYDGPGTSSSLKEDMSADASAPEPIMTVCYTYGPIPNLKESALFSEWLDERGILYKQRQTDERGRQLSWVYLAPQQSRALAEATYKDLRQKGVKDMRLIRVGDLSNSISLGLFSSQAAVNRRLNEIEAKGYQSVVVPYSGGKKYIGLM